MCVRRGLQLGFYRFDNDAGLKLGRAVAQLAIARGKQDGSPPL